MGVGAVDQSAADWAAQTLAAAEAYAEEHAAAAARERAQAEAAAAAYSEPLPGNNKQEFTEKNVRKDLEHEGAAAFENARARDEILNAKPPGPDIGIRGGSDSDYIDTYNEYKSGAITEEQAKSQMATTFSQEPQDRDPATGRYRTKEEQLADKYGQDWDKAHPK